VIDTSASRRRTIACPAGAVAEYDEMMVDVDALLIGSASFAPSPVQSIDPDVLLAWPRQGVLIGDQLPIVEAAPVKHNPGLYWYNQDSMYR
jgi:hypothetical protein